jgi:N utilization substance protein A
MVVSELRGEKIDIIPWNTEPARFLAKALSPARVREVFVDDETREATVVVPEDQLALAIGKEGLNARLAARLTGWKVDIQSDQEFAQAEAAAAYAGAGSEGGEDEFSGRCAAILSNGKRCPNAALPGTRYCGVPGHKELADRAPEETPAVATEEVPETATEAEAEELEPVARVDEDPGESRSSEEDATEEPREPIELEPEPEPEPVEPEPVSEEPPAAVAADRGEEDRPAPAA